MTSDEMNPPTVRQLLVWATAFLRKRGIETAREDAEVLLRGSLSCDRTAIWAHPDRKVEGDRLRLFHDWIKQRGRHYPIQYLLGRQEFYGRDFLVNSAVLIPRPDTETLVEACLEFLAKCCGAARPRVLDVGTGTGCLAVTLLLENDGLRAVATDTSAGALETARGNAELWGCADRIAFVRADLLAAFRCRPTFDLIVSNPPYVRLGDLQLQESVRRYEPSTALFAGETGLECYERVLAEAGGILRPKGAFVLELGWGMLRDVTAIAHHLGWREAAVWKDLSGIERGVVFRPRESG